MTDELQEYKQKCKYCPAMVVFAKSSETDSWMIVDYAPTDDGNIQVTIGLTNLVARVLTKEEVENAHESLRLHKSHFATCPKADIVRKMRTKPRTT